MEPEILKRGKDFHKRVQNDWEKTAQGTINREHTIILKKLSIQRKNKTGRLDIFVDDIGDMVSVVEIKSTDWDRVKETNRKKLISSHRRQVWKYIDKYLNEDDITVCPGMIYPKSPSTPGLKEFIENEMNEHGLQVVWYDDP